MVLSLGKLLMLATGNGNNGDLTEADQWLAEIGLKQYRPLFKKKGQNSLDYPVLLSFIDNKNFLILKHLQIKRKLSKIGWVKNVNEMVPIYFEAVNSLSLLLTTEFTFWQVVNFCAIDTGCHHKVIGPPEHINCPAA